MPKSAAQYDDTIEALRKLAVSDELRDSERQAIGKELGEIAEMLKKLEDGRVEIAVYGEINAGKSALLNALLGRKAFEVAAVGGKTRERVKADWTPTSKEFSTNGAKLVLVDTPGLNEVDGATRELVARETARYADLVLFVTDGDLNEVEFNAVKTLHDLNKPVILVLNKIDRFTQRELNEIRASVAGRVKGIVADQDFVFAAGQPLPALRITVLPDGSEREEMRERKPIVEDLQARIFEILTREGKAVVALNASLFASEMSERIARLKVEARSAEAKALIEKFMWGKATVVAFNPVPWLDILGVVASDATMIVMLSRVYGEPISHENAQKLTNEIIGAWGVTGFVTLAMHLAASTIKTALPGVGVAVTALPQGLAAAWATYIVGNAASVYFRDGGWGKKGAKTIVKNILKNTDRASVLSPVKDRLTARLRTRAPE
ncbi:MAG: DUF697 domain-containing protein [Hyphomicrobiales bacterium]|nr:DUF697 domain-containing protein [Hyphomicrobiales bacterium]